LLETAHGVVLNVYVKPNSKKFRIELDEDELLVLCHETLLKRKVNQLLLKHLSRLFNRKVVLLSGITSRQKKFLIRDIEVEEVN
jgi:uncharacterized protein (TIGR00251 family)